MAKKTSFWPNFGLFGPNLSSKKFFHGFDPYYTLDILASYHCIQFQGKLMNQTWKNGKKTNFGPNFNPFSPNLSHQIFFLKNLAPSVTRHYCQLSICTISEKNNDQILRKLSHGRKERWTDRLKDGQMDGWEWFHRMLSN